MELELTEIYIRQMLAVKQAADSGTVLLTNQMQALDGYAELANYRAILEAYLRELYAANTDE